MRKDTSVRVNEMRRNKLEMLVNHLLDNYLQEAKQDLLHNAENSGKDKTKST